MRLRSVQPMPLIQVFLLSSPGKSPKWQLAWKITWPLSYLPSFSLLSVLHAHTHGQICYIEEEDYPAQSDRRLIWNQANYLSLLAEGMYNDWKCLKRYILTCLRICFIFLCIERKVVYWGDLDLPWGVSAEIRISSSPVRHITIIYQLVGGYCVF